MENRRYWIKMMLKVMEARMLPERYPREED
jgi:hypothetical protein